MNRIRVQQQDFDVAREMSDLRAGRRDIGAVACFVGLVRESGTGDTVSAMTLEHYPGMTEKQLEAIVADAESRWPLQGVTVIHRVGRLAPGDQIVLVLTASRHRRDAYEANMFIMDYLKTRATFWKKESGADGDHWVEERDSDLDAVDRWQQPTSSA